MLYALLVTLLFTGTGYTSEQEKILEGRKPFMVQLKPEMAVYVTADPKTTELGHAIDVTYDIQTVYSTTSGTKFSVKEKTVTVKVYAVPHEDAIYWLSNDDYDTFCLDIRKDGWTPREGRYFRYSCICVLLSIFVAVLQLITASAIQPRLVAMVLATVITGIFAMIIGDQFQRAMPFRHMLLFASACACTQVIAGIIGMLFSPMPAPPRLRFR